MAQTGPRSSAVIFLRGSAVFKSRKDSLQPFNWNHIGNAEMENLTGPWIGEINGTNKGNMFVSLQHEGDRIYGEGSFNEPAIGTYKYQVQGITQNDAIKLFLTPGPMRSGNFNLGNVEVEGRIENQKIIGSWRSSIGTLGTFFLNRSEVTRKEETSINSVEGKSVFIVHGHDDTTKEKVARFIERLGIDVIILHEQVNKGMTIIEKFEDYAKSAGFAVALFTPDDVAHPFLDKETELKPRARQNVVLEMGYFVGSLGRSNVCVLYKGDVELPSDILGVVYTKMDESEAWKLSLARELKFAGFTVDLNKLI